MARLLCVALVSFAVTACAGPHAGLDGGVDGGRDAGGGLDAGRDAATTLDAAAVDAGHDAHFVDALVARDAWLDDFGPNPQADGGPRDLGIDMNAADLGVDSGPYDSGIDLGVDLGIDGGCRPPALGGYWSPVGTLRGALPGDTPAQMPNIVIDDLGRPVVVWRERTSPSTLEVHAARWDGAAWVALSGAFNRVVGSGADWPTIAIDHDVPIVTWQESGPGFMPEEIYAARWDEGAGLWTPLGGGLSTVPGATTSEKPSVTVLADGTIVVGWHEEDGLGGMDVHVSRWTGSSWLPLGGALSALPGSSTWGWRASVTGVSTPYVAWDEGNATTLSQVFVRRWDGAAWQPVGALLEALPMPSTANYSSLAIRSIAGTEQLAIAWRENPIPITRADSFAARWIDPAWTPLGATPVSASLPTTSGSGLPHLALDQDGSPVMVWSATGTDQRLRVVRFEAGDWQPLGGPIDAGFDGSPNLSAIALDACGTPFVAFDEGVGMQEVFVYRYVAP